MKEENLRTNSMLAGVILALLFLLLCSTAASDDIAYLQPVDTNMRIFMDACLDEGYQFGDCYFTYVDSQCFGSVTLAMPTDWV